MGTFRPTISRILTVEGSTKHYANAQLANFQCLVSFGLPQTNKSEEKTYTEHLDFSTS
jgi:hypothetical protein